MKRFKQSRDVLKSHMGGDILNKFVENLPEYRHSTMSGQHRIREMDGIHDDQEQQSSQIWQLVERDGIPVLDEQQPVFQLTFDKQRTY